MSNTLKFGNGEWYGKEGTILAYNSENNNYKPLPFTFDRDSVATRVNKQGLIETVGADQPRVDYLNDSNGALLLEPSRTNLFPYSEFINDTSIFKNNASVTDNYSISPEGVQNAALVDFGAVGTNAFIGRSFSTTPLQYYTFTCYVRGDGTLRVYSDGNGTAGYFFTSKNLTLTSEWQRFEFSYQIADGVNAVNIVIQRQTSDTTTEFELYGLQYEQGSYPTSIIKTQGSAVTRLAESCSDAGNDQVINSTEGVLYLEAKVKTDDIFAANCIAVSDGTDTNRLSIIMYGNINSIRASMNVGGVSQFDFNLPSGYIQEQYYKIAVSYKVNDCKIFINGTKISTDTSATMPSLATFDRLSFDLGQGSYDFYGNIKDVRVYNQALTDTELISLTS